MYLVHRTHQYEPKEVCGSCWRSGPVREVRAGVGGAAWLVSTRVICSAQSARHVVGQRPAVLQGLSSLSGVDVRRRIAHD